jgi:SWIM zinc finger
VACSAAHFAPGLIVERVEFIVEGSQGDEYGVTFEINGAAARASCTCPAGSNGQYCKHRLGLMDGDASPLLSDNNSDVARLPTLLRGTDLEAAHGRFSKAEAACAIAKYDFDAAKKALSRVMHGDAQGRHRGDRNGLPAGHEVESEPTVSLRPMVGV